MPLYNNNVTMRALGITRTGNMRTGRVQRLSGFGAAAPASAADFTKYAASNWLGEGCLRASKQDDGTAIKYPASSFCNCMYGDADRISTENRNSADFQSGSPMWACLLSAEYNFPPWSDDSLLFQIVASGGKADPLKSLPMKDKVEAYKALIRNVGDKEIGISGVASFKLKDAGPMLEQAGVVPRGTFGQASATTSAILNIDAYRAQVRARSDNDLSALVTQFKASPPDAARDPENAAVAAAVIEEYNYRLSNPCPSGMVRSPQEGLDADGRARCIVFSKAVREGLMVAVREGPLGTAMANQLRTSRMDLDTLRGRIYGTSDAPPATEEKSNTALLVGGGLAVLAALFLLKK